MLTRFIHFFPTITKSQNHSKLIDIFEDSHLETLMIG